ncbi:DUF1289 domain-containing protein [Aureimonas glaciei]|uniref:DUF1289 domain-containing protein n=1 Tax=Aureimonas glaciei TaxID=1776957 RepID=A0A916XWG7_9HYPH|nr:DUF1289 domain-containing protein [Aureimonas glaciei]GGD16572.1 DUF1289 domain-containing protein [Aureimonas glaciei]
MSIESPCTKICVIEPRSGHCRGCGRSGEEIGGWIAYSPQQRRDIMALLPARIAALGEPATPRPIALAAKA